MAGCGRKSEQTESLFEARTKTAPCVPKLREDIKEWASGKNRYKGVTDTTRILLEYWFHTDHILPDRKIFRYYDCQREAVETLVYLYEVAGAPKQKDLLEKYAVNFGAPLRLLQYDDFPRYCIKMATGSGKTVVMSLVVAWQFFNAIAEGRDDYAKTFLIIAPNVIVFERLRTDFAEGTCWRKYPVVPKELEIFKSEFEFYVRGDSERAGSAGALYLTNIQQFYERPNRKETAEPDPITGVLGEKPPAQMFSISDFDERIIQRGEPCMVINDEAHHTHDEKLQWNEFIRRLNESLPTPLIGDLDFTATPRYQKGELFTWTVYDYPLKQAILDGIVKRPLKGIAKGFVEAKTTDVCKKYEPYFIAAVERWREYHKQLAKLKKKPILFIMMNSTAEADEVGKWLRRKYQGHFAGDKTLVIHTDRSGEISKRQVEEARKSAKEVDQGTSPINAIVSVLMLREGWDVKNVVVVLGLRPYTSKANILPEQTIGRGLRLMFGGKSVVSYKERVDVLGNDAFLKFVEDLEKEEDMAFETFDLGEKPYILTIEVDPEKMDKDIILPDITPLLTRKKSIIAEIAELDVSHMALSEPFPVGVEDSEDLKTFLYEGYDIITLEKLFEKKYEIPEPQNPEEVIAHYAERIAKDIKLPSMFSAIAKKVYEYLKNVFFGRSVDLNDAKYLKAISRNAAQHVIVSQFARALRPIVIEEKEPQLISYGLKLSNTEPFPHSEPTYDSSKCIFTLVPCANEFEKSVARFFDKAEDVERFSSLPQAIGFMIAYTDSMNNIRHYRPDFIVVRKGNEEHFLVETKGREDIDVQFKDEAAIRWCQAATDLTGIQWNFIKILQKDFEQVEARTFDDLRIIWQIPNE